MITFSAVFERRRVRPLNTIEDGAPWEIICSDGLCAHCSINMRSSSEVLQPSFPGREAHLIGLGHVHSTCKYAFHPTVLHLNAIRLLPGAR